MNRLVLVGLVVSGAALIGASTAGADHRWGIRWNWGSSCTTGQPLPPPPPCDAQREYDEGWDRGAQAAMKPGFRDGSRGRAYCDQPEECLDGQSARFIEGYLCAYRESYRRSFDFGCAARKRFPHSHRFN